jgi:hypothetical protein
MVGQQKIDIALDLGSSRRRQDVIPRATGWRQVGCDVLSESCGCGHGGSHVRLGLECIKIKFPRRIHVLKIAALSVSVPD